MNVTPSLLSCIARMDFVISRSAWFKEAIHYKFLPRFDTRDQ
jgi:hypothetical protein